MTPEIKKYANSGDLKALKYIFVDALDIDPTFAGYEEDYNYCKSIPGLLEHHVELTPFSDDEKAWTEAYWLSLKKDFMKNFSDERMSHMRNVAKVYWAEKYQRIMNERSAPSNELPEPYKEAKSTVKSEYKAEPTAVDVVKEKTPKVPEDTVRQPVVSAKEKQARQIEEERRKNEAKYKADVAREKEDAEKIDFEYREKYSAEHDVKADASKKAIGIAVAAVAAAAMILILVLK